MKNLIQSLIFLGIAITIIILFLINISTPDGELIRSKIIDGDEYRVYLEDDDDEMLRFVKMGFFIDHEFIKFTSLDVPIDSTFNKIKKRREFINSLKNN